MGYNINMDHEKLLKNPKYQKILATIDKEVDYVDIKPYSHNIISCTLQEAAEEFGHMVVNDIIVEFELEALGWSKVNKEDNI